MSPQLQASAIFRAIRGDQAAISAQRAAYQALAASITGTQGGMQLTSGTENGQSFTASYKGTPQERLIVLDLLFKMIERDSAGTKSTIARFR